jgi:hypothetical protein
MVCGVKLPQEVLSFHAQRLYKQAMMLTTIYHKNRIAMQMTIRLFLYTLLVVVVGAQISGVSLYAPHIRSEPRLTNPECS